MSKKAKPWTKQKKTRAIDEHRLEINPCSMPGREPGRAFVMTEATLMILKKTELEFRSCGDSFGRT